MPDGDWLASERAWLDDLTERVLTGEIVYTRAVPRWGLSIACASVTEALGQSAVSVRGRDFTEDNQKSMREKLDADIANALDRTGCAQLIFDDYGRAVRRSQGGALHSMLYRLLVDAPGARDTGAFLVARPSDSLDLNFSGSPLLSRAVFTPLPLLGVEDATELKLSLSELKTLAGDSTWLARQLIGESTRIAELRAVEHLDVDRRRLVKALPPDAIELLLGARDLADVGLVGLETLRCLGSLSEGTGFEPSTFVKKSKLLPEVGLQSPAWPSTEAESVSRFADLLAGADDAIWVDRYALAQPGRLRAFIEQLRSHTAARLRLLVSDDRDRRGFADEIREALAGVVGVEVRFMTRLDRHRLHDRHLVLPALGCGFVLPTAGVVLSVDDPGSAVAVSLPALPLNYGECWGRGRRVFPT